MKQIKPPTITLVSYEQPADEQPAERAPGRMQRRLLQAAESIAAYDPDTICFQHTVFCQTGLPYRDPGDVRSWERQNGHVHLKVLAGEAMHPEEGRLVELGLPFGPKARLIIAHLNAEALRTRNPEIEIGDSLTHFAKRMGLASHGRNMRIIKDQFARTAAASMRLGVVQDGRAITINSQIVTAFDLWFPKDNRQRVLWPRTVCLSRDYFDSLQRHAVPLDERAIFALSESAMALDIYAWLAQRLHRIDPNRPTFIPWTALHVQFGWHYDRIRKFREVFRQTLDRVRSQYRGARIELNSGGMILRHSPPPIKGRLVSVLSL